MNRPRSNPDVSERCSPMSLPLSPVWWLNMVLYFIGNACAALISVGLLVGTLRYTRRAT